MPLILPLVYKITQASQAKFKLIQSTDYRPSPSIAPNVTGWQLMRAWDQMTFFPNRNEGIPSLFSGVTGQIVRQWDFGRLKFILDGSQGQFLQGQDAGPDG